MLGKSVFFIMKTLKRFKHFFLQLMNKRGFPILLKSYNSIELKNKELSKLKQFKQAMLQEIFPKKDRYPTKI